MITYKMNFIRTGSTYQEGPRTYVGQQDLPLSAKGKKELETLQTEFEYPWVQRVYTSPLLRCIQTADLLYPDTELITNTNMLDMSLGDFEGHTFEDLQKNEAFALWAENSNENPPPHGEDTISFTQRVVAGLEEMFYQMMEERITDVAVITHRGVIMTLLAAVGIPKLPLPQWSVDNGAGYTLLMTPQMWMRDQSAEVFGILPFSPSQEEEYDFDSFS